MGADTAYAVGWLMPFIIVGLIILFLLWVFLPIAVFRIKSKMDDGLIAQRKIHQVLLDIKSELQQLSENDSATVQADEQNETPEERKARIKAHFDQKKSD